MDAATQAYQRLMEAQSYNALNPPREKTPEEKRAERDTFSIKRRTRRVPA